MIAHCAALLGTAFLSNGVSHPPPLNKYAKPSPNAIEQILNAVEAEAGIPNRPFVFNTPIASAANATSRMNGNIICVSVTASAAFSGGNPRASSGTTYGAIRTPMTVITLMTTASTLNIRLASRHASISFFRI